MQLLSTFYALLFPLVRNIVYIIVVTKCIKLSTLQSLLLGVFSLLPTSNIYAYVPIEQRTYSEHVASLLVVIWKLNRLVTRASVESNIASKFCLRNRSRVDRVRILLMIIIIDIR